MTAKRDPAPEVEWQAPSCGVCGEDTTSDADGFECAACGVTYDREGWFGMWVDEDGDEAADQCPARAARVFTLIASAPLPRPHRCLRTAGHADQWHHAAAHVRWREPPPYGAPPYGAPGWGWRTITPEQAEELQAALDARTAPARP